MREQMKQNIILDGSKILFHQDRLKEWQEGKKIAPITIGCSITNYCNYNCVFCTARSVHVARKDMLKKEDLFWFLDDAAEIGIKAVNVIGDGENTLHPCFCDFIEHGKQDGLDMGVATNGYLLTEEDLNKILPCLSYIRFSVCAADPTRYAEIHGAPADAFQRVRNNIARALEIRKRESLDVAIGMQMVLMPEFADQILPLTEMGKGLGVDYLQIKQCSDTQDGALHVKYEQYESLHDLLKQAEARSTPTYQVSVMWKKINEGTHHEYSCCYGAPFFLQLAGDGTLAPCYWLTLPKNAQFHFGNIKEQRFKDMWESERYWEIIKKITDGSALNPQKDCCYLCWPHNTNNILWQIKQNDMEIPVPMEKTTRHQNFL